MQFSEFYTLLLLMLLLFLITSLIRTIIERRKAKKEQYKTRTLIKCSKCGYTEERDFQVGDYILKPEKECPKCKTIIRIHRIYDVKVPKK